MHSSSASNCGHVILATADGLRACIERRDMFKKKCAALANQLGGSRTHCAPQRAGMERLELNRQMGVEQSLLNEIQSVLNHLQVVEPATDASCVAIGTVVSLQRYSQDGDPMGTIETYYVGGYGSTDLKTSPPTVSYESRIIAPLMGKTVNDEWYETRLDNGKRQFIELIALALPSGKQEYSHRLVPCGAIGTARVAAA